MQELNRRNTETVELVLKDMSDRIYNQQIQVNNLHTALCNMTERLNSLEQTLIIQRVQLTGLGPSKRNNGD